MERFGCSDSLDAFISICSSQGGGRPFFSVDEEEQEQQPSSDKVRGYSKEFQAMLDSLDQEDDSDDGGPVPERKRRLKLDQVKALERHFEVENKLEPERKMKIAAELDLEPRQVTIWFQNRRARWKTKQLERDYGLLKVNYDALKMDYGVLEKENASLSSKLRELKEKLRRERNPDLEMESNVSGLWQNKEGEGTETKTKRNLADGSSETDSNGAVNNSSVSSMADCFELSNTVAMSGQFMKTIEEQSYEEPCNFCSVDQAPSLHW